MFHSLTKIQTKQLKKNQPLTLSTVREKDYAKFAPCLQPPTINHEQHWQFNNDQKHKLTIPLHLSSSITTLDKKKKKVPGTRLESLLILAGTFDGLKSSIPKKQSGPRAGSSDRHTGWINTQLHYPLHHQITTIQKTITIQFPWSPWNDHKREEYLEQIVRSDRTRRSEESQLVETCSEEDYEI